MRDSDESRVGDARRPRARYLIALISAVVLSLGAAVPVFAAQQPAVKDGGTVQPQVVGGTSVPDGKYKFMTAVRDVNNGSSVYEQQFCGGTLIDRDSVLTAAHCLETRVADQLRVTVGITALNENQGQSRRVTNIFRHPNYTTSEVSYRYDAAVLELASPVRNIAPVKIPATTSNAFEKPGRTATVAGWGNTVKQPPSGDAGNNFPYRMREAKVPVVSDGSAKRTYDTAYATALMVAAGREGKDTCQGDSGGPIFFPANSGRYQIGITSFGAGCGSRGFPGVYAETNASTIRPFIIESAAR